MFGESFTSSEKANVALVRLQRHGVALRRVESGRPAAVVSPSPLPRRSRRRAPPPRVRGSAVMRLRLDIEYDGTGFSGLGGAARVADRRRHAARGARALSTRGFENLAVAGRTDAGVHALGSGGERRRRGRAAVCERRGGAELDASGRPVGHRRRRGGGGFPCPPFRASTHLPLPDLAPAYAVAVRATAELVAASAGRRGAARRFGRSAPRRARLPGVHADGDPARRLRAPGAAAAWHRRGDALELEITADSFLRHMVRTLVGTMVEQEPEEIAEAARRAAAGRGRHDGAALGSLPRLGRRTRKTASAHG